ncbi:MAG: anthranilate phosphoribosyltransferase [Rhodothermales bacterium]|nr:anthranilate phosphoribosyltransferase [Rhodothermales bacterium]
MKDYLRIVAAGSSLTTEQAAHAMQIVMNGSAAPEELGGFLMGVTARGATVDELVGFAGVMREFAVSVECDDPRAVDLCGTGGDGVGTFNVSTTAVFVVAGSGVTVAKHGNRSVSSSCGSADVLDALGVQTNLRRKGAEHCLRETGIAFIFAPHFHPAMKHVMPVRRALGVRTFFNMLGPLCNPAGVNRQLVGAFSHRAARDIAAVLARLGSEHVIAVHSDDGLDEVSVSDESTLFEFRRGASHDPVVEERRFAPEYLGLDRHPLSAINGSTAEENATILRRVLSGERGAHRDIVVANAAHAIYTAGVAESLEVAKEMACASIDSGKATRALEDLRSTSREAPTD